MCHHLFASTIVTGEQRAWGRERGFPRLSADVRPATHDGAMLLRSIRRVTLVLLASTAITVACDDDEEGEHGTDEPPICKEISEACHDLDTGPGMAQDCHLTAHEGDAAECEMVHDECIAFCTGAGTGESGGSSSGG